MAGALGGLTGSVLPAPDSLATASSPGGELREFGDALATRRLIYRNVLNEARKLPPVQNKIHTLELADVDYEDPDDFSLKKQKEAILTGQTLYRRLRGTWRLKDNATGDTLDEKKLTIAQVPHMTQRGTFIINGSEYSLSSQLRLRPGVFTRVKESGEVESHVNVLPGNGVSHRILLDPETGVFKLNIAQSKVPLISLLKAMGVKAGDLQKAWGNDLFYANAKAEDPRAIGKLYAKLTRNVGEADTIEDKAKALATLFGAMKLDPEVTQRTLGHPHAMISPDSILASTRKLVAVHKGEEEPDDRDNLAFQQLLGPEDLIAERVKTAARVLRPLLWKTTFNKNLSRIQPGFLNRHVLGAITSSGLGQSLEESNPSDMIDQITRVTRMGEGGIPSVDSIPDDSRSVQPSHFGFVDSLRTPESSKAGVDLRMAMGARKGEDGRVYSQFLDPRSGKLVYRSPQDLEGKVLAFPGELTSGKKHVAALVGGKLRYVNRQDVDYTVPEMEHSFNALANMIAGKSGVKGQRVAMGSRMLTQALPLVNAEAPLVQSGIPGEVDRSYEQKYGSSMGAVHADQDGQVVSVSPDGIKVKYADGSTKTHETYDSFPLNRKTQIHNTATVQPGQPVKAGDVLAKSNFTDDRGATSLGLNLRTAFVSWRGSNYEDAKTISESAAKKLKSIHTYQHDAEWDDHVRRGKNAYLSLFPSAFDRGALAKLDADGVVKPGSVVNPGDPLVLMARERERAHNQISRSKDSSFKDDTQTWGHQVPGIVTDVAKTKSGVVVVVKSEHEAEVGDKLCYDDQTEALTSTGWKPISEITIEDRVATLVDGSNFQYLSPSSVHSFDHVGRMYSLVSTQVDLLVTDNHKLYAAMRKGKKAQWVYDLREAQDLFGKRYRLKKNGRWLGRSPAHMVLPPLKVVSGQGGRGETLLPELRMPIETYAMILGMFLSEGNVFDRPPSGSYGIDIHQRKPVSTGKLISALKESGLHFSRGQDRFRIYGKQLMLHFSQFGLSHQKFIPNHVFGWGEKELKTLYKWLMWGDGCETGTGHSYCTVSRRLADDVQRLLLHVGMSGNIDITPAHWGEVLGKKCYCRERYDVRIYRSKNNPTINHSHVKEQNGQKEEWVEYRGKVYCVTMPVGHVIYVRRNDQPVWCGNSNRFGGKGVIADIIPDDQMPHDSEGRPFEVLENPLGIISRTNPFSVVEAILGKIAAKTGKPYKLADFQGQDLVDFAEKELAKHGLSDLEDITDPTHNRKIPKVLTGSSFYMKLHHTSESKSQGRGTGGYTADEMPSKGSGDAPKRMALMDNNAILSAGATEVLRDKGSVRGQKNLDWWAAYMSGKTPPEPRVPLVHRKFFDYLRASGINPVREGGQVQIMALTDKDVDQLAGTRYLQNAETVSWKEGLKPIPGGLFSPDLTGSHGGTRWSAIKLEEPMPSPVMEGPIRTLLGLTEKGFEDVLAGRESLRGQKGPAAIATALNRLNVDQEMTRARMEISGSKRTLRDKAIKRLALLKGVQNIGVHPRDWVMSKVPVLPPLFRPVSIMAGNKLPMVADPNLLYKEVFEANENLKHMTGQVDDVGEERLALYRAFKGVTGLGDPITPKNQERKVKGVLQAVFGGSSKFGMVQRKLLGSQVDTVGRATVSPDADLDMDQVGLPEKTAWSVYQPHVIRSLVRRGVSPIVAADMVQRQQPMAREALLKEMSERPVIVSRAPVLHRYGVMAFWPKMYSGHTLRSNPVIAKGYGLDHDGDQMNFHVPASDEAVKDAVEKMLPSRNLFSTKDFKVHQLPTNEFLGGLYTATSKVDNKKPEQVFHTKADAIRAYEQGLINADTRVVIMEP